MQDVQAEGKFAIDSPGSPTAPEIPPEEYSLRKYLPNIFSYINGYSNML